MAPALVLLGCGYTLTRLALAEAGRGRRVLAATRDPARRARLAAAGVELGDLLPLARGARGAHVAVSVPPEAGLDAALAEALAEARPARLAYVSSTGVYGAARGRVDEDTPAHPTTPAGVARLAAEDRYRALGGVVLRAAGIYGPGRGVHRRLAEGTLRVPDDGGGRISRVHVDDLVEALRVALERGEPGGVYAVADGHATPLAQVADLAAARLGLPSAPRAPREALHESLRGDRDVSPARLRALGWVPRYPDYASGLAALLAEEAAAARGA